MRTRAYPLFVSILVIAALGLGLSGCSKSPSTATVQKPSVYDLGVGLFGPNQSGTGAAALRFSIQPGATFAANYVTDAQTGGKKLQIIALDNGKQIDFKLNGAAGATHTIVALTGPHTFPIVFGPLSGGLHNIVVIAIADPDNHRLDAEWRAATESYTYPTKVISLSVGSASLAEKPAGAAVGESVPDSDFGNVALSPTDKMELAAWPTRNVKPGETIGCFIHLGNPSSAAIPYALCILLDGRQISLAKGALTAVSGSLVAGQRLILPVQITAPDKPGTYELMAVAGINPFVQQPKTTSDKNTAFYFGSARTALVVE